MDKMQRQSFHQLYAKPILFVGVLLLLAGFYSYTRMQTNLFPEVLFPRITVIADAGQQPVDYAIALHIRPKLMTAIGAILALMPLALGLGMGAQMQQPLAVAVIGGFVVGLPLLLVVLPTLMRRIYR